jgi:hypothetical protein
MIELENRMAKKRYNMLFVKIMILFHKFESKSGNLITPENSEVNN